MVTAVAFCWSVANKIKKKETLRYYNPPKKKHREFLSKTRKQAERIRQSQKLEEKRKERKTTHTT